MSNPSGDRPRGVRRGPEEVREVPLVCRMCSTRYAGRVVMMSVAVPGVMGPVGERLKNALDNCPKCGSYAVEIRYEARR
ncbi:Hypothetical Protein RradSPS_0643 [Rubrobacter radiotolerans]|uniref:Uncharacterized protein n=1 Tax=Rubrobacter radiotolerans TaxID=42256 RepID=A0A023X143_RUBRA|nr:hypothetical protein [Rubrobacter radiotolerans]AHY45926.1 Hypothetical Protein RradSPS_0643 [Rubrobacter radiotolerans]MDX5893340.1 hypothetical protein [Rubrobacter radiotolerans]SMC03533.1 hypothetical protein SAMN00767673_0642 [Rubrobacter radiotolerans DSM 5868]